MKCTLKQFQAMAFCLVWTGLAVWSSRGSALLLRILQ